jgi:hypothetical protein
MVKIQNAITYRKFLLVHIKNKRVAYIKCLPFYTGCVLYNITAGLTFSRKRAKAQRRFPLNFRSSGSLRGLIIAKID